jgi:hypothetical protein
MKHTARSFHDRVKKLFGREITIPKYVVILAVILLIAFDLRIQSVIHTVVDTPIRGDAREYFLYGYNLKHYGTYSKSDTLFIKSEVPPTPDAMRAPVYGFFVSLFLGNPPTDGDISRLTLAQAVISTLAVLIVFLIARKIIPVPYALAAAGLTAISPHLVASNIYILSETLFSFMLVVAVYAATRINRDDHLALLFLTGVLLAAVALTHPMMLYFIVPSAIFFWGYWGWKKGYKKTILLLLGFFVIYGSWTTRNMVSLGAGGDNHLMRIVLRTGIYPDLRYQDKPETFPYPYHHDPDFKETSKDLPSVLTELVRAFRESPAKQLRWYLVGKPAMLYSWDLKEAYRFDQRGDVFTYPVVSSPYNYLPHFRLTHWFMRATHGVWVALMAAGIVIAWLPRKRLGLSENAAFIARFVSLLLLYHTAIMIAGVSIPRHALSMRPFLYILSMLPVALACQRFLKWQAPKPAKSTNNYRRARWPKSLKKASQ